VAENSLGFGTIPIFGIALLGHPGEPFGLAPFQIIPRKEQCCELSEPISKIRLGLKASRRSRDCRRSKGYGGTGEKKRNIHGSM